MSRGENVDNELTQQLATLRGHIEGVSRMLDEGRGCAAVLHQVVAIQGSLSAVRRELVERHIARCVPAEMTAGDPDEVVRGILDVVIGGPQASHTEDRRTRSAGGHHQTEET